MSGKGRDITKEMLQPPIPRPPQTVKAYTESMSGKGRGLDSGRKLLVPRPPQMTQADVDFYKEQYNWLMEHIPGVDARIQFGSFMEWLNMRWQDQVPPPRCSECGQFLPVKEE